MKNTAKGWLLQSLCGLLWAFGLFTMTVGTANAQTVVAVSNIGQPYNTGVAVGLNASTLFKEAVSFTTGTSDLELVSITIGIAGAFPGATGLSIELYSSFSATGPEDLIETLVGPIAPSAAGYYTYTPTTTVNFLSGTQYWLVATADTSPEAFFWNMTAATLEDSGGSLGWTIGDNHKGGSQFGWGDSAGIPQFSIQTSGGAAIPEPATMAWWFGITAVLVASTRIRSRRKHIHG